ncbi:MAG: hypothetical protein RL260_2989 [Pseudomonadota bacterium]|jgi:hypothetical protein
MSTPFTSIGTAPSRILLDAYPQLRQLAWHLPTATALTPQEALNLYERHWRHIDQTQLAPDEQALIEALAMQLGGGRLLV